MKGYDKSLSKFMDRFGWLIVQMRNLNPKVALHSMLLALQPSKFINNCTRNIPTAWKSYMSMLRATFRWKRYRGSKMKFDRLDKSVRKGKVA